MSTIKDVAKYAGVSTATVSYILNGTKTVLPETRQRVMEVIEKLNYAPNPTAQSFKTGKKHTVAFIIPDISNNYFANITKALETKLRSSGYSLILANTNEDSANEIMQLKQMTSGIADGLILASTAKNFSEIKPHIPKNFPVVLIDRKLDGCPYDIVSSTDNTAVLQGISRLAEKGHKRIGYIGDTPHLSTAIERQQAYREALYKVGLPLDEKIIVHASSLTHNAYEKAGELLKAGCTALVIGNNTMTIDAYIYILNHLNLYADVPILGYQHKDLPPLFYSDAGIISLNETDMGNAAAEQILKRIKEPLSAQREIIISNTLLPKAVSD